MDNNSGVNTIILVLILILIVGFVVWLFRGGFAPANNAGNGQIDVNVDLPDVEPGGDDNNAGG